MKFIPTFLIATMIACASTIAEAANWKSFFVNGFETNHFIELSGMVRLKNGNIRTWLKETNPKWALGRLSLYEVNCEERSYTIRKIKTLAEPSADAPNPDELAKNILST